MKKRTLWAVLILAASLMASPAIGVRAAVPAVDDETPVKEDIEELDGEEEDGGEDEEETSSDSSRYEDEIDALNAQLKELQKQKDAVQTKLNSTTNALEKKMIERSSQEEKISLTRQEVALLQQRVEALEGRLREKQQEIEEKEREIELKQQDIDMSFEQYKKRMRATYMAGQSSALSMMLGASDFTDFLMRSEFIRATAEHDEALVASLKADRESLEQKKAGLEQDKVGLEEDKKEVQKDQEALKATQKELEGELQSIASAIQDIATEQEYYKQNKAEIDKQMAEAEKEINAIYERLKPQMSETFVGGEWAWPVPGHHQITSSYMAGDRSDSHTGTDIAGGSVYGEKIVAANDGTVVFTKAGNTGYGNYVIVDHGGGYSSLYAHMSAISVSVGDTVARGVTKIGEVGSTGWATGPHLHFEVRINGKHTNPMAFIS